jgi:hypothetical protein
MVGAGRVKLRAAVGPPPVVMRLGLGQHHAQMPPAENQHPVGDLVPYGEHEPLGLGVRARAPGRDLDCLIPALARTASKDAAARPSRSFAVTADDAGDVGEGLGRQRQRGRLEKHGSPWVADADLGRSLHLPRASLYPKPTRRP